MALERAQQDKRGTIYCGREARRNDVEKGGEAGLNRRKLKIFLKCVECLPTFFSPMCF